MDNLKDLVNYIMSFTYFFSTLLLVMGCLGLLFGVKTRKEILKHIFYNLSAVLIALSAYEVYLGYAESNQIQFASTVEVTGSIGDEKYTTYDKNLGYKPAKDGVYQAIRKSDKEIIYQVNYTIKNELRSTPNSNESSQDCALFFGGSFTFGEGLNDTMTLPYHFNELEDQRFRLRNYGLHGYGPQQMLEHIKNRVRKDLSGCQGEKVALYSFLFDHVRRAAGYTAWNMYGPRYEVEDMKLVKKGQFAKKPEGLIGRAIAKLLSVSRIYQRLFTKFNNTATAYDILRTREIIKQSSSILQESNVKLYVLLYDLEEEVESYFGGAAGFQDFIEDLEKNNISTLRLSDVIADYLDNIDAYTIHELDRHPNRDFNKIIARFFASNLQCSF